MSQDSNNNMMSMNLPGFGSLTEADLDPRLCVSQEVFDSLIQEVTGWELAHLLDAFSDYLASRETSWLVDTPLIVTGNGGNGGASG